MKFKKYLPAALIIALAAALAIVLWITLFSRIGADSRRFYPPFWSYKAILNGSVESLVENIENVILFIPIGMITALFFPFGIKKSLLIGLSLSLLIECSQWYFWLGSFEIDDMLHNTIGTGIGTLIVNKTNLRETIRLSSRKSNLFLLLILTSMIIAAGFGYQGLRWQEMKRLAAMNDQADGTKNLLVLSPDPIYIGETDFKVIYISDGSILIKGSAENRAWIEIGKLKLEPGKYSFSGLSSVDEKTIAIELEYFNIDQQKYISLTPDVGPIEKAEFEFEVPTKVRALIELYEGAEGTYSARPVIYRKD